MSVKASNQVTLLDLTDGFSVISTNENHTFIGTTTAVNGTQTATTQIVAFCGEEQVPCSVGTISCPTGLSAVSDGKTPAPTITITATSALTVGGSIDIPVTIDGTEIVINKKFSFAIAFRGATGAKGDKGDTGTSIAIKSKAIEYQTSLSGTTTPTGMWSTSIPPASQGQYLWTRTTVTYSDNTSTVSYSVARQGENGISPTVSSTNVEYQQSPGGTTPPTGTWSSQAPTATAGQYMWTRTTVTYSDGKTAISYAVTRNGSNGAKGDKGDQGVAGEDALVLVITSSNGMIFKNTAIATTLTAHIYKGGTEITGDALSKLGTIKWYKDGTTTPVDTGQTLTISTGDVTNRASYIAELE